MRAWVSTLRKGYRHFADRTRTEPRSGRALIRSFHISHYLAACGSFGLTVVRSLPVFPISGPVQALSNVPTAEVIRSSSPRASLAPTVIRAARLAAILLRIARGLRHADKGPARL